MLWFNDDGSLIAGLSVDTDDLTVAGRELDVLYKSMRASTGLWFTETPPPGCRVRAYCRQVASRRGQGALASWARRLFGRFDAALNAANLHLAEKYPDGPPKRLARMPVS